MATTTIYFDVCDIIRVDSNMFTKSLEVVNEVTSPAIGVYSIYSLFN